MNKIGNMVCYRKNMSNMVQNHRLFILQTSKQTVYTKSNKKKNWDRVV